MDKINSYTSPFNLGHKALEELFDGPVTVQEKIDGSQFSFRRDGASVAYRSRNQEVDPLNPGMFGKGIEQLQSILPNLPDGYTFRGEYLKKPQHNTLKYNRIPARCVIIFDIDVGDQDYLSPIAADQIAASLGLEFVPTWQIEGKPTMEQLDEWLQRDSILGGCKIEGLVFKNYAKLDMYSKKTLMGKYVSEKFREEHGVSWKNRNPGKSRVIQQIIEEYGTQARWMKAVQHLREAGQLENSPRDIGLLLKEVGADILKDHEEEIKQRLFKAMWKDINKGLTHGLPEFYKKLLAEETLANEEET